MVRKLDIVELLLKQGLIAKEQVDEAKGESQRTGLSLEKSLEKLGFVTKSDIANVRAASLGVPFMDLTDYIIDAELVKLIPERVAKKYMAVPLFKIGQNLTVAMVNPQDIIGLDQIRKVSKMDNIEPVLSTEEGIQRVLDSYYGVAGSADDIIKSIEKAKTFETGATEAAEDAPVVKLINILILQAVKDRASDIHIEPEEDIVRIRYRIDGILHEVNTTPKNLQSAIISRVKVLAKMDIAESRKAQDGRIRMKLENKNLDIRVSTFPTVHGENVVMRLLDKSSVLLGLKELGFLKETLSEFEKLIHRPNGMILVTGPTGSGKTTTLYSALSTINSMEKNIITVEDPVEYEFPLIRQTQVNPKAGITFANGLRSILRQDPDIIMVGEIRDKETADIAIQAAMTGHLVFSTLHTNDAPSALTRLIEMGVEPFLISTSIIGILAQRLVRTVCDKCKESYQLSAGAQLGDLGIEDKKLTAYRGKGCNRCKDTGFIGRVGIFELLVVNEEIRELVNSKASIDQIKKKAIELGTKTLKEDGIEKIKEGSTSVEEVLRVTQEE